MRNLLPHPIPLYLYFPHTTFIIKYLYVENSYYFDSLQVGFSTQPITNVKHKLSLLPLSNNPFGFFVCFGSSEEIFKKYDSQQELIENIVKLYWLTPFTKIHKQQDWLQNTPRKIAPLKNTDNLLQNTIEIQYCETH